MHASASNMSKKKRSKTGKSMMSRVHCVSATYKTPVLGFFFNSEKTYTLQWCLQKELLYLHLKGKVKSVQFHSILHCLTPFLILTIDWKKYWLLLFKKNKNLHTIDIYIVILIKVCTPLGKPRKTQIDGRYLFTGLIPI